MNKKTIDHVRLNGFLPIFSDFFNSQYIRLANALLPQLTVHTAGALRVFEI